MQKYRCPLILGSSSPARRALLERLHLPFTVVPPHIDETAQPGETANRLVTRLALEKAQAIATRHPNALIIGCDQVGTLEENILCKPLTHANAIQQLNMMSGNRVRFYTALCLLDANTHQYQIAVEIYDVFFRKLTSGMIENYLMQEEALQCAGSFQAEGLGITLIKKFAGDDYTALIGLPLIRLVTMLNHIGIDVLDKSHGA